MLVQHLQKRLCLWITEGSSKYQNTDKCSEMKKKKSVKFDNKIINTVVSAPHFLTIFGNIEKRHGSNSKCSGLLLQP